MTNLTVYVAKSKKSGLFFVKFGGSLNGGCEAGFYATISEITDYTFGYVNIAFFTQSDIKRYSEMKKIPKCEFQFSEHKLSDVEFVPLSVVSLQQAA